MNKYEIDIHLTNDVIQGNLNELKVQIDNEFSKYVNLVEVDPTAERIKELKEIRTQANKVIKAVDGERRKAVKHYQQVIKEAKSIVDETMQSAVLASDNITNIINDYERKDEKLVRRTFTIECTQHALKELNDFIKLSEIKLLKVEKEK